MGARRIVSVLAVLTLLTACTSTVRTQPTVAPSSPYPSTPRTGTSHASSVHTTAPPMSSTASSARSRPRPTRTTSSPTHSAPPVHADRLPLTVPTDDARQVVTVTAGAQDDTQGTVRAWRRVPGGWRPVGPPLPAWLGSDGMTPSPNESLSAVPMGSFTLTQAFGHDPDPGTRLPYRQTTPADWWISEAGSEYNTEQHCSSGCPFTQGSPNEHLYYETPYYDYAAVIDYNTRNSPTGVRQGAGSAFFLHVSVGAPTQGCVAIEQTQLVRILRWLRPADHPRILIGTV